MAFCPSPDFVCGWVSSPDTRGTISIVYSCLSTVWLCTWTCLCLNIPSSRCTGWRFVLYKFRWQLFAVFFPEVLVALAAEQWASAKQSVRAFSELGCANWTIRHGFFADMGGLVLAPRGSPGFPIDSFQLAYLVRHGYLRMPRIELDDIRAINKADGLSRVVTLGQMSWFCLSCFARASLHLGISPLELETLSFILCTLHTFYFWYHKPLDPARPLIIRTDKTLGQLFYPQSAPTTFLRTPLDFVAPPHDPKSLFTPFWFGFTATFRPHTPIRTTPAKRIPNSLVHPAEGVGWGLTIYILLFQLMYYGLHIGVAWTIRFPSPFEFYLWEVSNVVDAGLITIFILFLALGTHFAPFIGDFVFATEASTVLEVASMLPAWAKVLLHGPFVFGYITGRLLVLGVALVAMRALPRAIYEDVEWSNFIPHI